MIQRYDFAPLDGITKVVFRQVYHRMFGGADRYFIPFFSPTDQHILTKRDQRELDPAANAGLPVVPQVMTCRAPDFLWAAEIVADMGYTEVNLNLGCPSGTVTAKGKGAGFLAKPEELERFLDTVFDAAPCAVSIKTRLGLREPEESERLLDIYNRYPIACLTIHPRVQKQFYKGTVHRDWFAWAAERSRNPLCYNGDLVTVEDCTVFAVDFPAIDAVMIGRGAIADPALLRKLRGGVPNTWHIPLLPQKLQLFPFWQRLYFPFQTQRAPLIRAGHACGQPHGAPRPCASGPSGQFPVMLPDPAFHVGTYPAVQAAIRTAQQIDMPDPFLHVLPVSRNGTKINPHLSGARESGLSPGHSAAGHACRRTS